MTDPIPDPKKNDKDDLAQVRAIAQDAANALESLVIVASRPQVYSQAEQKGRDALAGLASIGIIPRS